MGNNQARNAEEARGLLETIDDPELEQPISYQDAVCLLSDYLKDLTNGSNDGSSYSLNQIEQIVTKFLSKAIIPPFVSYKTEDEELSRKILSLNWVKPHELEAKIDMEDIDAVSNAIYALAVMTTRTTAFEMLSCVVDCCKYIMEAIKGVGKGADELIPVLIFVVLKSNPPKLYSHLQFISEFFEANDQPLNTANPILSAVPRIPLYGKMMDCCFANLQVAVSVINNIEADEETREIQYGQKEPNYFKTEFNDVMNGYVEAELESAMKSLEENLNKLIEVRRCIRDEYGDTMTAVADKLDKTKMKVHTSKAVGLFASIGGGVVAIVGFSLMFTTFGVSAVLIPIGASVGGAGSLTFCVSGLVEYGIKKSTANDIKKMRIQYEEIVNEIFRSLKNIEEAVNNFWIGSAGRSVIVIVDIVMKLSRLAVVVDNVGDVGAIAFEVATTAGKGIAIAGVVFNAILLPIDLALFGISLKKLATRERCQQANEIRAWLDQKLPDEKEISQTVCKLKTTLLDFHKNLRDQDPNADSKGEELLKKNLEEIKKLIDSQLT